MGVILNNPLICVLVCTTCCLKIAIRIPSETVQGTYKVESDYSCPFKVSGDETDALCDPMLVTAVEHHEKSLYPPGKIS